MNWCWFVWARHVCLKLLLNRLFSWSCQCQPQLQVWGGKAPANTRCTSLTPKTSQLISEKAVTYFIGALCIMGDFDRRDFRIAGNLRHKWVEALLWNKGCSSREWGNTRQKLIKNNSILVGTDSCSRSLFSFRIIHRRRYWWFATFGNFPTILLLHYSSTSTF